MVSWNVSWITGHVAHSDDLPRFHCGTSDALIERDFVSGCLLVVALAEPAGQQLPGLVDKVDAECVEVDERTHGHRDFCEQLIQIEDGTEFLRNVGQHSQGAVLPLDTA